MPRVSAVERMAEALTGAAVTPVEEYERVQVSRAIVGRGSVMSEASRHPHEVAEAVRWQVCEGELVQIVGRPRGIWRTTENPVDVLMLTDPVLPMAIDEEVSAASLDPNPVDQMLGAGGIAFENCRHASEAYPELWSTPKAAEHAFTRSRTPPFRYERDIHTEMGESSGLLPVRYQRKGAGQKPVSAWFDPLLCPDPARRLAELLGELAFEPVTPPAFVPPAPPAAAAPPPSPANDPEPPPMPERSAAPAATTSPPVFDPPDLLLSVALPGGASRRLAVFGPLEVQRVLAEPPEPRLRLVWPPPKIDPPNNSDSEPGRPSR